MNTIRGFLVEFFVAQAIGAPAKGRVEWAPFDVEGPDGTRVEVKSTAYLQSWSQARRTTPSWTFKSVAASSMWDDALAVEVPVDPFERVHAWVFGLQTCTEPARYQPLDTGQWEFRVVPHRQLLATGQKSARISTFDAMGVLPVSFDDLGEAIRDARVHNDRLAS